MLNMHLSNKCGVIPSRIIENCIKVRSAVHTTSHILGVAGAQLSSVLDFPCPTSRDAQDFIHPDSFPTCNKKKGILKISILLHCLVRFDFGGLAPTDE